MTKFRKAELAYREAAGVFPNPVGLQAALDACSPPETPGTVQRYGFWHDKDWEGQPGEFEEMTEGPYVLYADYARVEAERDEACSRENKWADDCALAEGQTKVLGEALADMKRRGEATCKALQLACEAAIGLKELCDEISKRTALNSGEPCPKCGHKEKVPVGDSSIHECDRCYHCWNSGEQPK